MQPRLPAACGNYLPHAQCVNEAVERDAIPFARYLDLVRLRSSCASSTRR